MTLLLNTCIIRLSISTCTKSSLAFPELLSWKKNWLACMSLANILIIRCRLKIWSWRTYVFRGECLSIKLVYRRFRFFTICVFVIVAGIYYFPMLVVSQCGDILIRFCMCRFDYCPCICNEWEELSCETGNYINRRRQCPTSLDLCSRQFCNLYVF